MIFMEDDDEASSPPPLLRADTLKNGINNNNNNSTIAARLTDDTSPPTKDGQCISTFHRPYDGEGAVGGIGPSHAALDGGGTRWYSLCLAPLSIPQPAPFSFLHINGATPLTSKSMVLRGEEEKDIGHVFVETPAANDRSVRLPIIDGWGLSSTNRCTDNDGIRVDDKRKDNDKPSGGDGEEERVRSVKRVVFRFDVTDLVVMMRGTDKDIMGKVTSRGRTAGRTLLQNKPLFRLPTPLRCLPETQRLYGNSSSSGGEEEDKGKASRAGLVGTKSKNQSGTKEARVSFFERRLRQANCGEKIDTKRVRGRQPLSLTNNLCLFCPPSAVELLLHTELEFCRFEDTSDCGSDQLYVRRRFNNNTKVGHELHVCSNAGDHERTCDAHKNCYENIELRAETKRSSRQLCLSVVVESWCSSRRHEEEVPVSSVKSGEGGDDARTAMRMSQQTKERKKGVKPIFTRLEKMGTMSKETEEPTANRIRIRERDGGGEHASKWCPFDPSDVIHFFLVCCDGSEEEVTKTSRVIDGRGLGTHTAGEGNNGWASQADDGSPFTSPIRQMTVGCPIRVGSFCAVGVSSSCASEYNEYCEEMLQAAGAAAMPVSITPSKRPMPSHDVAHPSSEDMAKTITSTRTGGIRTTVASLILVDEHNGKSSSSNNNDDDECAGNSTRRSALKHSSPASSLVNKHDQRLFLCVDVLYDNLVQKKKNAESEKGNNKNNSFGFGPPLGDPDDFIYEFCRRPRAVGNTMTGMGKTAAVMIRCPLSSFAVPFIVGLTSPHSSVPHVQKKRSVHRQEGQTALVANGFCTKDGKEGPSCAASIRRRQRRSPTPVMDDEERALALSTASSLLRSVPLTARKPVVVEGAHVVGLAGNKSVFGTSPLLLAPPTFSSCPRSSPFALVVSKGSANTPENSSRSHHIIGNAEHCGVSNTEKEKGMHMNEEDTPPMSSLASPLSGIFAEIAKLQKEKGTAVIERAVPSSIPEASLPLPSTVDTVGGIAPVDVNFRPAITCNGNNKPHEVESDNNDTPLNPADTSSLLVTHPNSPKPPARPVAVKKKLLPGAFSRPLPIPPSLATRKQQQQVKNDSTTSQQVREQPSTRQDESSKTKVAQPEGRADEGMASPIDASALLSPSQLLLGLGIEMGIVGMAAPASINLSAGRVQSERKLKHDARGETALSLVPTSSTPPQQYPTDDVPVPSSSSSPSSSTFTCVTPSPQSTAAPRSVCNAQKGVRVGGGGGADGGEDECVPATLLFSEESTANLRHNGQNEDSGVSSRDCVIKGRNDKNSQGNNEGDDAAEKENDTASLTRPTHNTCRRSGGERVEGTTPPPPPSGSEIMIVVTCTAPNTQRCASTAPASNTNTNTNTNKSGTLTTDEDATPLRCVDNHDNANTNRSHDVNNNNNNNRASLLLQNRTPQREAAERVEVNLQKEQRDQDSVDNEAETYDFRRGSIIVVHTDEGGTADRDETPRLPPSSENPATCSTTTSGGVTEQQKQLSNGDNKGLSELVGVARFPSNLLMMPTSNKDDGLPSEATHNEATHGDANKASSATSPSRRVVVSVRTDTQVSTSEYNAPAKTNCNTSSSQMPLLLLSASQSERERGGGEKKQAQEHAELTRPRSEIVVIGHKRPRGDDEEQEETVNDEDQNKEEEEAQRRRRGEAEKAGEEKTKSKERRTQSSDFEAETLERLHLHQEQRSGVEENTLSVSAAEGEDEEKDGEEEKENKKGLNVSASASEFVAGTLQDHRVEKETVMRHADDGHESGATASASAIVVIMTSTAVSDTAATPTRIPRALAESRASADTTGGRRRKSPQREEDISDVVRTHVETDNTPLSLADGKGKDVEVSEVNVEVIESGETPAIVQSAEANTWRSVLEAGASDAHRGTAEIPNEASSGGLPSSAHPLNLWPNSLLQPPPLIPSEKSLANKKNMKSVGQKRLRSENEDDAVGDAREKSDNHHPDAGDRETKGEDKENTIYSVDDETQQQQQTRRLQSSPSSFKEGHPTASNQHTTNNNNNNNSGSDDRVDGSVHSSAIGTTSLRPSSGLPLPLFPPVLPLANNNDHLQACSANAAAQNEIPTPPPQPQQLLTGLSYGTLRHETMIVNSEEPQLEGEGDEDIEREREEDDTSDVPLPVHIQDIVDDMPNRIEDGLLSDRNTNKNKVDTTKEEGTNVQRAPCSSLKDGSSPVPPRPLSSAASSSKVKNNPPRKGELLLVVHEKGNPQEQRDIQSLTREEQEEIGNRRSVESARRDTCNASESDEHDYPKNATATSADTDNASGIVVASCSTTPVAATTATLSPANHAPPTADTDAAATLSPANHAPPTADTDAAANVGSPSMAATSSRQFDAMAARTPSQQRLRVCSSFSELSAVVCVGGALHNTCSRHDQDAKAVVLSSATGPTTTNNNKKNKSDIVLNNGMIPSSLSATEGFIVIRSDKKGEDNNTYVSTINNSHNCSYEAGGEEEEDTPHLHGNNAAIARKLLHNKLLEDTEGSSQAGKEGRCDLDSQATFVGEGKEHDDDNDVDNDNVRNRNNRIKRSDGQNVDNSSSPSTNNNDSTSDTQYFRRLDSEIARALEKLDAAVVVGRDGVDTTPTTTTKTSHPNNMCCNDLTTNNNNNNNTEKNNNNTININTNGSMSNLVLVRNNNSNSCGIAGCSSSSSSASNLLFFDIVVPVAPPPIAASSGLDLLNITKESMDTSCGTTTNGGGGGGGGGGSERNKNQKDGVVVGAAQALAVSFSSFCPPPPLPPPPPAPPAPPLISLLGGHSRGLFTEASSPPINNLLMSTNLFFPQNNRNTTEITAKAVGADDNAVATTTPRMPPPPPIFSDETPPRVAFSGASLPPSSMPASSTTGNNWESQQVFYNYGA